MDKRTLLKRVHEGFSQYRPSMPLFIKETYMMTTALFNDWILIDKYFKLFRTSLANEKKKR